MPIMMGSTTSGWKIATFPLSSCVLVSHYVVQSFVAEWLAGWVVRSFVSFIVGWWLLNHFISHPVNTHQFIHPPRHVKSLLRPPPYRRATATTTTTARAACKTDLMLESCNQLKQVEDTAPPVFSQSVSQCCQSVFIWICLQTHPHTGHSRPSIGWRK